MSVPQNYQQQTTFHNVQIFVVLAEWGSMVGLGATELQIQRENKSELEEPGALQG